MPHSGIDCHIYVTNIPAQKEKKSEITRIFDKIEDQNRPKSAHKKKEKGAGQAVGIISGGMLPKKNRVGTKAVENIFKTGKFINSPHLTFKFIPSGKAKRTGRKISFIAPKSVAKLAVERNRLRRLGYSALEKHLEMCPPGLMGVFIFRRPENHKAVLEYEIAGIFDKIN